MAITSAYQSVLGAVDYALVVLSRGLTRRSVPSPCRASPQTRESGVTRRSIAPRTGSKPCPRDVSRARDLNTKPRQCSEWGLAGRSYIRTKTLEIQCKNFS
ncbi:hypothetical protein NDU88_007414 [Pleurodeles waltl]|uniref:Uncharacterized protein n=1 Tax=Pleurodeles waltl TaxID=8319 RepID=A0AAV7WIH4_PLEWA|nr:hypothetical protein NDU88_007414 [Pleurodeles waltl]